MLPRFLFWKNLTILSLFWLFWSQNVQGFDSISCLFLVFKSTLKELCVSPYLSTHVTTTRHMAAILIPKLNKSAFSISAYPLEASAVTVNGKLLEWQARKGIQVTHCSLTGQWISVELTPISFTGCNISLFALQVLLNILMGNSKFLCTLMTVTLPADASHLRREHHTRNLLVDHVKGLLFQFSVDTPETSTSFSNSVRSTCAANSVRVCANSILPCHHAVFADVVCTHEGL